MITPQKFRESFLPDEQRFAFWFQHTVQEVIKNPENYANPEDFSSDKSEKTMAEQNFWVYIGHVPKHFLDKHNLRDTYINILHRFGWTVTSKIPEGHMDWSLIFHWTSEDVETEELKKEYEKKYRYVTFNNVMWEKGYTNIHIFDKWFTEILEKHRNRLSYNELLYNYLIIPYDEINRVNKSFVKDFIYEYNQMDYSTNCTSDKELETITLKEPYVEHLKYLGWRVKDEYIDGKYCLVCY